MGKMSAKRTKPTLDMDATIWRYMNLTKFIHLISTSTLFLPRADKLDDPFEGAIPECVKEQLSEWFKSEPRVLEGLMRDLHARKNSAVTCWYLGEAESDAMWKLYVGKNADGVAICSTAAKLKSAMCAHTRGSQMDWVKKVTYLENSLTHVGKDPYELVTDQFFYKRRCFEHERELRGVIRIPPGGTNTCDAEGSTIADGISVPIDPNTFIHEIRVSPYSKPWFFDIVKTLAKKFGLNAEVKQSEMARKPDFLPPDNAPTT